MALIFVFGFATIALGFVLVLLITGLILFLILLTLGLSMIAVHFPLLWFGLHLNEGFVDNFEKGDKQNGEHNTDT